MSISVISPPTKGATLSAPHDSQSSTDNSAATFASVFSSLNKMQNSTQDGKAKIPGADISAPNLLGEALLSRQTDAREGILLQGSDSAKQFAAANDLPGSDSTIADESSLSTSSALTPAQVLFGTLSNLQQKTGSQNSKEGKGLQDEQSDPTETSTELAASMLPPPLIPLNSAQAVSGVGSDAGQSISENTLLSEKGALADWSSTANLAAKDGLSDSQASFSSALHSAQTSAHQAPASVDLHIQTPVHDSQWGQSFREQVVWLAKNDNQTAQISINPPQLGPVQISLNIDGNQANATFASPHGEVRQLIEDSMPRLREMFSEIGISLGQANVGAQLPQQQRDTSESFSNGTRFSGETAILPGDGSTSSSQGSLPIQRGRGLVDLFA
jgi:flagellar hook-length control protein FliK